MFYRNLNDASNFVAGFTKRPQADFGAYAHGYHKAANALAEAFITKNGAFRDFEAYPVVFLYRHAFELSLKHILYSAARLSNLYSQSIEEKLANTHNLPKLAEPTKALLMRVFPNDHGLHAVLESMSETASQWNQLDPTGESYRYPITRSGDRATSEHQIANMRSIATAMTKLLTDLEAIHFGLNIETDLVEDMIEHMQAQLWAPSADEYR
jgi:hypothetical protein